jgi:phage I-like protein
MDKEVRLTLEMAELPEWLRLLPLGRVELVDGRPPFEVDPASLEEMVRAFGERGTDLVVDYEHQSLKGVQAPAAGWIKGLEARLDGLWARVEWTSQAQEYLSRREYRYFSPVLRLDPESRRPLELLNVALTNVPAMKGCTPLVAKWGGEALSPGVQGKEAGDMKEGPEAASGVVEEMRLRLGLGPESGEGAVWRQTLALMQELAGHLGLPAEASAAQLLGEIAALKARGSEAAALQEEVVQLRERMAQEEVHKAVIAALRAGKITPAQKAWALAYCRRDPESFREFVEKAPQVVPLGVRLPLGEADGEKGGLNAEELALCRALNLSPEAYLQAKSGADRMK